MNVQAEISLYPLRTNELGHAIDQFLGAVKTAGLTVQPGNMSSTVSGDIRTLFSTIRAGFEAVAENDQVVLIMKVSNACPSGNAMEGMNEDVG